MALLSINLVKTNTCTMYTLLMKRIVHNNSLSSSIYIYMILGTAEAEGEVGYVRVSGS